VRRDYRIDGIEHDGEKAVAAYSWTNHLGDRVYWSHLLKLRDGKIVDMQDHLRRPPG
jgi:hypothetical protein